MAVDSLLTRSTQLRRDLLIDIKMEAKGGEGESPKVVAELAPEKPATLWTRRLIIAAFWLVVVCLGLPHWVWTTSIQRSELPLESMNAWAEGKVSPIQCLNNQLLKPIRDASCTILCTLDFKHKT